MRKLLAEETKVINNFDEYFKHLEESKLLIGVGIANEDEPDKVFILNTAVAAALTVLKGKEVEDFFA